MGVTWQQITNKPHQFAALENGRQVGVWDSGKRSYWRLTAEGKFETAASSPPVPPPRAADFPGKMIDGTMNFGLLKGKEPSGTGSSICAKQVPTEELIAAIGPAMVPRLGGGTGHPLRDLVGAIETLPLIGWLIVAALILLILKRPENGE